jgi:hypothetical protein
MGFLHNTGDLLAGAHHGSNHPVAYALIEEGDSVSASRSLLGVPSVKPGFGGADGGALQPQPHLRGDALTDARLKI